MIKKLLLTLSLLLLYPAICLAGTGGFDFYNYLKNPANKPLDMNGYSIITSSDIRGVKQIRWNDGTVSTSSSSTGVSILASDNSWLGLNTFTKTVSITSSTGIPYLTLDGNFDFTSDNFHGIAPGYIPTIQVLGPLGTSVVISTTPDLSVIMSAGDTTSSNGESRLQVTGWRNGFAAGNLTSLSIKNETSAGYKAQITYDKLTGGTAGPICFETSDSSSTFMRAGNGSQYVGMGSWDVGAGLITDNLVFARDNASIGALIIVGSEDLPSVPTLSYMGAKTSGRSSPEFQIVAWDSNVGDNANLIINQNYGQIPWIPGANLGIVNYASQTSTATSGIVYVAGAGISGNGKKHIFIGGIDNSANYYDGEIELRVGDGLGGNNNTALRIKGDYNTGATLSSSGTITVVSHSNDSSSGFQIEGGSNPYFSSRQLKIGYIDPIGVGQAPAFCSTSQEPMLFISNDPNPGFILTGGSVTVGAVPTLALYSYPPNDVAGGSFAGISYDYSTGLTIGTPNVLTLNPSSFTVFGNSVVPDNVSILYDQVAQANGMIGVVDSNAGVPFIMMQRGSSLSGVFGNIGTRVATGDNFQSPLGIVRISSDSFSSDFEANVGPMVYGYIMPGDLSGVRPCFVFNTNSADSVNLVQLYGEYLSDSNTEGVFDIVNSTGRPAISVSTGTVVCPNLNSQYFNGHMYGTGSGLPTTGYNKWDIFGNDDDSIVYIATETVTGIYSWKPLW